MLSVYAARFDAQDPVSAISVGDRPTPDCPDGWTVVQVKAASLNHHDLWSARGVGLRAENLPMILGCDAAGLDENGREVVIHSVVNDAGWRGAELLDPALSILSERHQGTFAERVAVPTHNVLPKPPELSLEQAACLPTAWLTAYRMLFGDHGVTPGSTVLVQGASGGLSTALIMLGAATGLRVWVTGRSGEKRTFAEQLGADQVFESGARLPERVDAVMDSVGAPTWSHSLKSLRKGGTMVVAGGTGGYSAETEVARVFTRGLRIVGSAMGSREDFRRLLCLCVATGLRPPIQRILPLEHARDGFSAMANGELRGKIVFSV